MLAHIEHQVIEKDGVPLFVLVPYDENFPGVLLSQMEKPRARLRQTTRQRIAAALEIEEAQLRI